MVAVECEIEHRPVGTPPSFQDIPWSGNIPRTDPVGRARLSSAPTALGFMDLAALDVSNLPKEASSKCASLTPAFCNCSRTIGVFAFT